MHKITQIDHTADVGFIIEADSLNELFEAVAHHVLEVMVNTKKVKQKITKKITLKNEKIDQLLFNFIEELIFLKDSKYIIFSKCKVKIQKKKNDYELQATAKGEKINPKKHELRTDIKAITLHNFYVKKEKTKYKASVILDI